MTARMRAARHFRITQRQTRLRADAAKAVSTRAFSQLVDLIPGEPWVRTPEMRERFGIEG